MENAFGCEEGVDGRAVIVEAEFEWAWREYGVGACSRSAKVVDVSSKLLSWR